MLENEIDEVKEKKALWYTIKTQTNYERKAKSEIEEKLLEKYDGAIEEIFIPTETVVNNKGGKKTLVEKIYYPGYIFIKAKMIDQMQLDIKACTKNQGLMMSGDRPSIVPFSDIAKMKAYAEQTEDSPTMSSKFKEGDLVSILEGPFQGYAGSIERVFNEKQRASVNVTVFGRETPVELDFKQFSLVK